MNTSRFAAAMLFLLLCSMACGASPGVVATYEPVGEGYWLRFAVYNTLPENQSIWSLLVRTSDVQSPSGPDGWTIRLTSRDIQWFTSTHHIPFGKHLGGFVYLAEQRPVELRWSVQGSLLGYSGTVAPTLIPEPSSLLAVFGGLAGVGGMALRRRRR